MACTNCNYFSTLNSRDSIDHRTTVCCDKTYIAVVTFNDISVKYISRHTDMQLA